MKKKIRIGIACDHAGFELKEYLKAVSRGIITDYGTYSDISVDYADYVHPACEALGKNVVDVLILICGSANGVAMTANKHQKVRAALCWNRESASLARAHNDANVLCIPTRFVDHNLAYEIVNIFMETAFEGGRHFTRVEKIPVKN